MPRLNLAELEAYLRAKEDLEDLAALRARWDAVPANRRKVTIQGTLGIWIDGELVHSDAVDRVIGELVADGNAVMNRARAALQSEADARKADAKAIYDALFV